MSGDLRVPFAEQAEKEAIGCAVAAARGYQIAAAIVSSEDFYVPAHARLFRLAADLPDANEHHRVEALPPECRDLARHLVGDRGRWYDVTGHYSRQVAEAARRRRAMAAAAEIYNLLGQGAGLEDVRPLLEEVA